MPNRLASATAPYRQQHADNPDDWYPWGAHALERAQLENKPILLSIGYSACHWCHVMAHESFEDAAVAAVMNEHFINVKVDREERPDIDQIYQSAHQMLTRRTGGWPLTMFLTPDQAPFFAGTYFPKEPKHGMPGFIGVMERVLLAFRDKRAEIDEQNKFILGAFGSGDAVPSLADVAPAADFSRAPIDAAVAALAERFDHSHGGFGDAPKFPHPAELGFLLRQREPAAAAMAVKTLEHMAAGGIFDHLGGGFCRYSVDREWMIPHFEKMLYDNGPLLALYTDAWRLSGNPRLASAVDETAGWIMREMQSPEGGYYSSLDADSDGEEGKFYRWDKFEVRALLSPAEFTIVEQYFGLAGHANFDGHHWHLHEIQPLADAAQRVNLDVATATGLIATARVKLLAARERRVRPSRDEKILTAWNALAIVGMTRAAHAFNRPDWLASARRANAFIVTTLWTNGRLLATYKDGRAHLNAYLDDYAYLLLAQLELLQADPRSADVGVARALADAMLDQFEDQSVGGFFFTSHDHERLIHRTKQGYDNATPSGNGIAAFALQRLGHLLGETRYIDASVRALGAFYPSIVAHPAGYASLLVALDEQLIAPRHVVLRAAANELADWNDQLRAGFYPDSMIVPLADDWQHVAPTLAPPAPEHGVNAYVCQGVQCLPPASVIADLRAVLSAPR